MFYLYAIFSAIFSAAAAILQKVVLRKIDAVTFSFSLSFFGALAVLGYASVYGFPSLELDEIIILIVKTLLGAAAFLNVMLAIEKFELSSVLPVLAFTPALVALTAFLALGENLTPAEILGMLLMLVGLYVLEIKGGNLFKPVKELFITSSSKHIVYAMLLFTVTSVMDKLLIGHYRIPPLDFIIMQQIIALPVFALFFLVFGKSRKRSLKNASEIWLVILLIAAITLLYRFLYVESLKYGAVALALTLKRLSVFFAVAASSKLLNEKNIGRKIIATTFILVGGYFIFQGG